MNNHEPLKHEDMDIVGSLFAIRFTDGCATLYIEDDGLYHPHCTFDKLWLRDLEMVAQNSILQWRKK
jgi:hypothetical protein